MESDLSMIIEHIGERQRVKVNTIIREVNEVDFKQGKVIVKRNNEIVFECKQVNLRKIIY